MLAAEALVAAALADARTANCVWSSVRAALMAGGSPANAAGTPTEPVRKLDSIIQKRILGPEAAQGQR
jgi:hypothetical protein